jgi:3-hydroxyacyl-CoA dehydrogenase
MSQDPERHCVRPIAAQTKRPERVVGMHFMNPVPIMQLVEIIRGLATDNAVYEATVALATPGGSAARAAEGSTSTELSLTSGRLVHAGGTDGQSDPGQIHRGMMHAVVCDHRL